MKCNWDRCNKEIVLSEYKGTKFCSKNCKNNYGVHKRRKKLKEQSVEYKGGSCQVCGYNRCRSALEFHHLDPNKKDFGIGASGHTRSWEKIKIELNKCIMVCANCHREIHEGIIKF